MSFLESGPVAQLGARFHGMEEVTGSIPVRSTNYFKHLEAPPFRDLVAFLSQIPKIAPFGDSVVSGQELLDEKNVFRYPFWS